MGELPSWLKQMEENWLFPELREDLQPLNHAKVKVVIGQFFEALGIALFGGAFGGSNGMWTVYPDGIKRKAYRNRDVLLEFKGGGYKYGFLIDVGQVVQYGKMLRGENVALLDSYKEEIPFWDADDGRARFNKPYLYYMFFVHNLSQIRKNHDTVSELLDGLSRGVVAAMVLPYPVVHTLVKSLTHRKYKGWDKGSRGGPGHEYFVRFSGVQVSRMANGQRSVREFLHGLVDGYGNELPFDPNALTVERYYIGARKVLHHAVNNFIMVVVREKDQWNPAPKWGRIVEFKGG